MVGMAIVNYYVAKIWRVLLNQLVFDQTSWCSGISMLNVQAKRPLVVYLDYTHRGRMHMGDMLFFWILCGA